MRSRGITEQQVRRAIQDYEASGAAHEPGRRRYEKKLSKNKRIKEVVPDRLLAEYDRKGQVVGFEIIAPVRISKITALVERRKRAGFRKFIKQAPEELVLA